MRERDQRVNDLLDWSMHVGGTEVQLVVFIVGRFLPCFNIKKKKNKTKKKLTGRDQKMANMGVINVTFENLGEKKRCPTGCIEYTHFLSLHFL